MEYVTRQSYLTNAFDNDASSRKNQDVGLDGLSSINGSINEQTFFSEFLSDIGGGVGASEVVLKDPSGDDFQYFLGGDLDNDDAQILERYKNFNGTEGNTPIISGNDVIARSGSPYPDNEDLNVDNTISELEEYYEYEIDLKKENLIIGSEYIVDIQKPAQIQEATWYLFRIPVQQFESKFGNISGFTSIRYARMILTGFSEPVVLRFANFRMVGARWRKYANNLLESGLIEDLEPGTDNFTVSVVNIEENSYAAPSSNKSPYEFLPGNRDRTHMS